jgi:hypothetical protein
MIHLTFPPTHSDADIERLFHEYGELFPNRLAEWIEIEKTFVDTDQDELRKISIEVLEFLRDRCAWVSTFALSTASFDLRSKVVSLAKPELS